MHVTITPPEIESNLLKSITGTWFTKLFTALILVSALTTSYTLFNLILEGL